MRSCTNADLRAELARREKQQKTKTRIPKDQFDSKGEADFYNTEIWPRIRTGEIVSCEVHKAFRLFDKAEYAGINLPKAEYTADFVIQHKSGAVEVIETKSRAVRRLQRDYVLRRRLFIEKYARPNGWIFREVMYK